MLLMKLTLFSWVVAVVNQSISTWMNPTQVRKKEVLHVELDEKKRKILAGRSAGKNLSTTLAKTDCEQNNPDHCTDHLDSFPHYCVCSNISRVSSQQRASCLDDAHQQSSRTSNGVIHTRDASYYHSS